MSPFFVVGVYLAVSAAAFLLGLRFFRSAEPRGDISVEQAKRFGRLLMMGATMLLLFLVAVWLRGDLKLVRG